MTCVASRGTVIGLLALALGGCGSQQFNDWSFAAQPASQNAFASGQQQPPVEMTGRWMLVSAGHGQCAMTFGGSPGSAEGSIAPEGGCPGKFFTSRKWGFDQTGLVIRDHNGEPLSQLQMAGGRFEGRAVSGETITLTR